MMEGFDTKAVNFYYFDAIKHEQYTKTITGEVTFGKPLESRYDTDAGFVWLDLLPESQWRVSISKFAVLQGKKGVLHDSIQQFDVQTVRYALIDSGCATIVLPTRIHQEFMKLFHEYSENPDISGMYLTPCYNREVIRSLRFVLDGKLIEIDGRELFQADPVNPEQCHLLVRGLDTKHVSLGVPFQRGFYTTFDYNRKQVGLARKL